MELDDPLTCEEYCMDQRQTEVGSLQTCADKWSRDPQQGMGREQMCSFVRVVNMTHSTLKMPEGHRTGGEYRKYEEEIPSRQQEVRRPIKPSVTEEDRRSGGKMKRTAREKESGRQTKWSVFSSAHGDIHHWRNGWQLIYTAAFVLWC